MTLTQDTGLIFNAVSAFCWGSVDVHFLHESFGEVLLHVQRVIAIALT